MPNPGFRKEFSNQELLDLFDLERREFRGVLEKQEEGKPDEAVQFLLSVISETGVAGFYSEKEASDLGNLISADYPDLSKGLEEKYRESLLYINSGASQKNSLQSLEALKKKLDVHASARHFYDRGRALGATAFLYALTKDRKWTEEFSKSFYKLGYINGPLGESDTFVALMPWHPGEYEGENPLCVSHILEALPEVISLVWRSLDTELQKYIIWYSFWNADYLFRAYEEDAPFNIPLHGLVAVLSVAGIFPGLKKSEKWKQRISRFFMPEGKYVSAPYCTQDGYFREGLGYQNVNQMLITRVYLLLKKEMPEEKLTALRKILSASYTFRAENILPDGSSFCIGDAQFAPYHEMELHPRNILHLGAALFKRPKLKAMAGSLHHPSPPIETLMMMGLFNYRSWKKMPVPDITARKFSTTVLLESGFLNLKFGKGIKDSTHALLNASIAHNHGHHDNLQVTLFSKGRKLISDSAYGGGSLVGKAHSDIGSAHSTARLSNLLPRGPRFQDIHQVKRKQIHQSGNGNIQFALAENDFFEGHIYRRALLLFSPPATAHYSFCLIWDNISKLNSGDGRSASFAGKDKIVTNIETNFTFHCVAGTAGTDGLSGWSRHRAEGPLRRFGETKNMAFSSRDLNSVADFSDTDANIQVSMLPAGPGSTASLGSEEGYVGSPLGWLSRPVLNYKWRGYLPFEAVYVLAPLEGCPESKPVEITGTCFAEEKAGAFTASIFSESWLPDLSGKKQTVTAEGLSGKAGEDVCIRLFESGALQDELSFELD